MHFGVFTEFAIRPGMGQSHAFDEAFNLVETAEKLGADSIWLAEVHFMPERSVLASPLTVASAIAARTSRIRIGLAVQVLPLINPLRAAEEAATVDHISKGRLDFGIGRSGLTKFYQAYDVPYSESRPRFLETLEVITKAWTEEEFSHEGEYYTFHKVNVVPKPYQKPHPPIRAALASADTFPVMGSLGHPIFINNLAGVPVLQERLGQYRKARKEAGHTGPDDVMLRIPAYVAETKERAISEPEVSTMAQIRYNIEELSATASSPGIIENIKRMSNWTYEDVLRDRVIFGTPESVVERLQGYQEQLGLSGVVLEVNYGGQTPYDRVINSMRLIAEKVMPKLK